MVDASPESPVRQCRGLTQAGRRCRNRPKPGSDFCRLHQTQAEQESEWLIEVADSAGVAEAAIEDMAAAGLPAAAQAEDRQESEALVVEDRLTAQKQERDQGRGRAAELSGRWREALARFGEAAERLAPEGQGDGFSVGELFTLMQRSLGPLFPLVETRLRRSLNSDYFDPAVWRGIWRVLNYTMRWPAGNVRRRLEGDYQVDEYGLDEEFLAVVLPIAEFFYKHYWRVEMSGVENVPAAGRALLVSNHSGVLPFDAAMIGVGVYRATDPARLVRTLVASWFPTLPVISILLQKTGQVQASPHNALRLLERDELVAVFPEGYKGVGKLYRDRYQLARFGRGGFTRIAVRTGAPIIPVAVVGAEEIYPMIGRADPIARLLGFPYFPITPTFPWTGPLGFVPLPSKWCIDIGAPIEAPAHGARAAANPALISQITEEVRTTIQYMLLDRLARRRSVFLG